MTGRARARARGRARGQETVQHVGAAVVSTILIQLNSILTTSQWDLCQGIRVGLGSVVEHLPRGAGGPGFHPQHLNQAGVTWVLGGDEMGGGMVGGA